MACNEFVSQHRLAISSLLAAGTASARRARAFHKLLIFAVSIAAALALFALPGVAQPHILPHRCGSPGFAVERTGVVSLPHSALLVPSG